jgi:hypothetical protein
MRKYPFFVFSSLSMGMFVVISYYITGSQEDYFTNIFQLLFEALIRQSAVLNQGTTLHRPE